MNMVSSGENGFIRHARVPHKVLYALLFTLIVVIIVLLLPSPLAGKSPAVQTGAFSSGATSLHSAKGGYNSTYPLTSPVSKYDSMSKLLFE